MRKKMNDVNSNYVIERNSYQQNILSMIYSVDFDNKFRTQKKKTQPCGMLRRNLYRISMQENFSFALNAKLEN